jgi:hypothetical protein
MRDISVFALTQSSDQTSDSIHESLSIFRLPSNTFRSTRCTAPPNYFGPLISDDFKKYSIGDHIRVTTLDIAPPRWSV